METFAEKALFDPVLEEQGGWISGEVLKQHVETTAMFEVMAEASRHTCETGLNPFQVQSGEILPSNLERNVSDFLVRKEALHFTVDSQKLLACIAMLKDQLVIA